MIILERLSQLEGVWGEVIDHHINIEYTKMLWYQIVEKHVALKCCGNNSDEYMSWKKLYNKISKDKSSYQ